MWRRLCLFLTLLAYALCRWLLVCVWVMFLMNINITSSEWIPKVDVIPQCSGKASQDIEEENCLGSETVSVNNSEFSVHPLHLFVTVRFTLNVTVTEFI